MANLKIPKGTMPWLAPNSAIARHALRQLDRPLLAWRTGWTFDPDEFYSDPDSGPLTAPEREVQKLGERAEWRMERVWLPDGEESERECRDYDAGCRDIAGRMLHPRCLDAYAQIAYSIADIEENPDFSPSDSDKQALTEALAWAEAGVCVLQQSLPYPFTDCLNYRELDNRPAHRVIHAYAKILYRLHPRKALSWFRAEIYMSPDDALGARFYFAAHTP